MLMIIVDGKVEVENDRSRKKKQKCSDFFLTFFNRLLCPIELGHDTRKIQQVIETKNAVNFSKIFNF